MNLEPPGAKCVQRREGSKKAAVWLGFYRWHLYKIEHPICVTFKLCKHHFLQNTGQNGHCRFASPEKLFQASYFRFHPPPFFLRYNLLPSTTKTKIHPEMMVEATAVQNPTQMRSCLSSMVNETTRSEHLWFVHRVDPGKSPKGGRQSAVATATLSLTVLPVIFKQDAPHHTTPTSFSALFIT